MKTSVNRQRATELLQNWAEQQQIVILGVMFWSGNISLTEGVLEPQTDTGFFIHKAEGIFNMFSPATFELYEWQESGEFRGLWLGNKAKPGETSLMLIAGPNEQTPISLESASRWIQ